MLLFKESVGVFFFKTEHLLHVYPQMEKANSSKNFRLK